MHDGLREGARYIPAHARPVHNLALCYPSGNIPILSKHSSKYAGFRCMYAFTGEIHGLIIALGLV